MSYDSHGKRRHDMDALQVWIDREEQSKPKPELFIRQLVVDKRDISLVPDQPNKPKTTAV